MAITLNLLPQDKIVSGSLAKLLKICRVLGFILLVLFVIYSIGATAFIILNNSKISKSKAENSSLKTKISELEVSEQQIVLIKDRIKKIETVKSIPSALVNLTGVIDLINGLNERSKVTELEADTKKVDLTVNFKSNFEMASFIDLVRESKNFKSVILSAYGLNPVSGYLVSFSLMNTK